MYKSVVYHGNFLLGEVEIYPKNSKTGAWTREIRISHFSPPSDRCPPLAVLHTIASAGFCFKMESESLSPSQLFSLHSACIRENKTAVVPLGDEELHLVAMPSRKNLMQYSCFWGFTVASGLYTSCLVMLNLRCLGIVFDLDETLIVANTMRSFEDRINTLQQKFFNETDQERLAGMLAEVKRYQDDKSILKQYIENDQVVDNGKVFKVQTEVVPPLSESHQQISRPIIRLHEKNIILTRVNPAIRDTSVLVRVRPAWEDLRSYLTARGRKRFQVYVCTMAERDYALEMWRLLDPESSLINSNELLNRIVCVKSESRKSLLSVFQDGTCHPKMALVIDDRLTVWNSKDKPRVHVVPAFAPYYAPQAEATSAVPVLCVARNVACNVRGGFFKEYDEVLLPRITDVYYEDEMNDFPSAPDVSNYLISEEDTSVSNGNQDPLCFEGMTDVEVERRLKDATCNLQAVPPVVSKFDPRPISSLHPVLASSLSAVSLATSQVIMSYSNNHCAQSIASIKPLGQFGLSEPSLQGSPVREEGEVNESELDPDTRRRLLILQHGQDTRDPPPLPLRPHPEVLVPPLQSPGSWLALEEEMNPIQLSKAPKEFPLEPETVHFAKRRSYRSSFFRGGEDSIPSDRVFHGNKRLHIEVRNENDRLRRNHAMSNYNSFSGEDMPMRPMSFNNRDAHLESARVTAQYSEIPAEVLQEFVAKLGAKVEYRTALLDTTELQFSVEAWFVGEKIGEGIGRTRKEAQNQAAERSIRSLANHYLNPSLEPTALHGDLNKLSHAKENGFLSGSNLYGYSSYLRNDSLPVANISEDSRFLDHRLEGSIKPSSSVAALKELCTLKGFSLAFQAHPSLPASSVDKQEVFSQVEVAGQVLGKGTGMTWEEAKLQAAKEAVTNLKSMLGQFTQKCTGSPRSWQATPAKWPKTVFTSPGEYHHLADIPRMNFLS